MEKILNCINENKNFEVTLFLERMVNNSTAKAAEWAKSFNNKNGVEKKIADKLLDDSKRMDNYFETVYKKIKINNEELEFYYKTIIETDLEYHQVGISSLLLIHFPIYKRILNRGSDEIIYTLINDCLEYNGDILVEFISQKNVISDLATFIRAIDTYNISEEVKLKLIRVATNFEKHIERLSEFVELVTVELINNIDMISDIINENMMIIENTINNASKEELSAILYMDYNSIENVYYSLVAYNAIYFNNVDNKLGVGLFVIKVSSLRKKETSYEELKTILKNLGEARKFEIVQTLMNKPHNGKELAKILNLTPATISHHITNLISSNIISLVVKDNNNVYIVNKKYLKENIALLNNLLAE